MTTLKGSLTWPEVEGAREVPLADAAPVALMDQDGESSPVAPLPLLPLLLAGPPALPAGLLRLPTAAAFISELALKAKL